MAFSPSPSTGRAVIFDMDGTLTLPQFDFDAIRREIGLPDEPLLEAVARLADAERARAEAILHRYESGFAATSVLQPHAAEVLDETRRLGYRCALMTRNSRASVDVFQSRHGLSFDVAWTREDGPCKPSPEPVLRICERLNATPAHCWVVGDYLYDLLSGRAAGARTALLLADSERPAWIEHADVVMAGLRDLLPHLTMVNA